ncbi:MAG: alpha/beta hydrolase-fold protein [Angustibacter sp.]
MSTPRRRTVLIGVAGAVAGTAALGAGVVASGARFPGRSRLLGPPDGDPTAGIPPSAEGDVRWEQRDSAARGQSVGFFTAVPAGHGTGAGLPVCLVLHGASATTADYRRFGLGRFLTAAIQAGVPPFVLAGADGGRSSWRGDGPNDDPQAMLREELPAWCAERDFDTDRMAVYGWSMGGAGALTYAQSSPQPSGSPSTPPATRPSVRSTDRASGAPRAVAALSPAISSDGDVVFGADRLAETPTGLWCGRSDPLLPAVQQLAARMSPGPVIASWQDGGHTRAYWNRVTPAAFTLIGQQLARAS